MISQRNKKNNLILKRSGGFTLIEMLVSIAVFMSVMVVAMGALLSIINANKKAQDIKTVVDNVNFAVENISKGLRVGKDYSCSTNYDDSDFDDICTTTGGQAIRYKKLVDGDYIYVYYRFVPTSSVSAGEGNIQKCTSDINTGCGGNWVSITAPTENVDIRNFTFYVLGTGTESLGVGFKKQPRVIMTAEGVIISKDNSETTFTLQTTASQRVRNI